MTTKKKLGFQIYQQHDGHYAKLIFNVQPLGYGYGNDYSAEIKFQSDDEKRDNGSYPPWYGFRLDITTNDAEDAAQLAKTIARVVATIRDRKDNQGQPADFRLLKTTPENLIWGFNACKIPRAAYDNRTSNFTPLSELPDAEYKKWRNDHESVLARSESEAKRLLTIEMAKVCPSKLADWLNAGSPCHLSSHCDGPEIRPDLETLEIYFAKRDRERNTEVAA